MIVVLEEMNLSFKILGKRNKNFILLNIPLYIFCIAARTHAESSLSLLSLNSNLLWIVKESFGEISKENNSYIFL